MHFTSHLVVVVCSYHVPNFFIHSIGMDADAMLPRSRLRLSCLKISIDSQADDADELNSLLTVDVDRFTLTPSQHGCTLHFAVDGLFERTSEGGARNTSEFFWIIQRNLLPVGDSFQEIYVPFWRDDFEMGGQ